MKMEKTPRYTQRERNMVLGFAAQYKDVIENKRTDAESNRKKDEVWRKIAKDFNVRVYHQRSSKQLRQLYKNMKLLLKKDLCGEGKGNRTFMDLLDTLSQQESVAQYISEQMSPSFSRQQKYEDDYDDSKPPPASYEGLDTDVIVIKSEDISDNEQSQNEGNPDDMDDDDDDCLSPKDIPEVCLEEEDDEIFATDLRNQSQQQQQKQHLQLNVQSTTQQQQQPQQPPQSQQQSSQTPEISLQNVGGIRVGSIGSMANMKSLQAGNNSALSITHTSASNISNNGNGNLNNNNNVVNNRQLTAEQIQQHLLLNGLGLSAVHPPEPPLPTLQRGTTSNSANNTINNTNPLLLNMNGGNYGHKTTLLGSLGNTGNGGSSYNLQQHQHSNNSGTGSSNNNHSSNSHRNNEYLIALAIEERKRKIDLLNAQIEYWKTLTKKLDSNGAHNSTPACMCHFPGKVNGLQSNSS